MSLNMEEIDFQMDNTQDDQEHPLAYMMGDYPEVLYPTEPKVGEYSYYDPRSKGSWVVKIQGLNGVRTVGCVMSSPHQIIPQRHLTCHGKIVEIVTEYKAKMNDFTWPSDMR